MMSSTNISNFAGDFTNTNLTNCPCCCRRFEDPRLLPCLHTFSKRCLEEIHRRSQGQGQTPRCPTCNQEMGLGEKGVDCLPSSFMFNNMNNIVDSVDYEPELDKDNRRLCSSCDEGSTSSYQCTDCRETLCDNCVRAHLRVRLTKDHHIERLDPQRNRMQGRYIPQTQMLSTSPIQPVSDGPPSFCDDHETEVLILYCDTCSKPICKECMMTEHNIHSTYYLKEAGNYSTLFFFLLSMLQNCY